MKQKTILLSYFLLLFSRLLLAQTTFSNLNPIEIPEGDIAPVQSTPYPSTILVSGMSGTISKITVSLYGLDHNSPDAIDILLVAPDGTNAIILSDVGGAYDLPNRGTGIDITLDDEAASFIPDNVAYPSGTYKITNRGGPDSWPSAPVPSMATTLAAFNEYPPNGEWKLYVVNDIDGCLGAIHGGWSLTITTENTLLPVRLSSFSSSYLHSKGAVALDWTTDMEFKSHSFVVERSLDGTQWKFLDRVKAAGNSFHKQSYNYQDAHPAKAKSFYRLKMVDQDGRFSYSGIVSVSPTALEAQELTGYFNARNSTLNISSKELLNDRISIQLIDLSGRVIVRLEQTWSNTNKKVLNLPPVQDGIYVLRITTSKGEIAQKLLFQRV